MSYSVTAHFMDENISRTNIYYNGLLVNRYEGEYNDDSYFGTGFNKPVVFEAIPKEGYDLYYWVYYIESNGFVDYSYSNPFIFDYGEDVTIYAVSAENPYDSWECISLDYSFPNEDIVEDLYINENNLYCFRVVFRSSGTAYFYTDNSYSDVVGYVGTTDTYDAENGVPDDFIESDTDGGNVDMSCEVEAGVPYYCWVRGKNMFQDDAISLYIESPPIYRPDTFEWEEDKEQGGEFNLTAEEWNAFTKNINEVRAYNYVENYEFDVAYPFDDFTDDMYNQAREAIKGIADFIEDEALIEKLENESLVAVSGEPVTAYMLNYIVDDVLNTL